MPHAVFLHSALTNDRVTDPRVEFKKYVLRLHQAESVIMFTMAGLVNAANTIPTTIAILLGLNPLIILVYSQVALSLLLPLPLVPLWWFTRNRDLMGVFTNRRITTILAGIFVLLIIGLNVLLLYFTFTGAS